MTPTLFPEIEIRELNDQFRRCGPLLGRTAFAGLWLVSGGIQGRGPHVTWSAISTTQGFAFTAGDDPLSEHDCGVFELDGEQACWKIDYVQRGKPLAAVDPSDNANTCRIITIMFFEEESGGRARAFGASTREILDAGGS